MQLGSVSAPQQARAALTGSFSERTSLLRGMCRHDVLFVCSPRARVNHPELTAELITEAMPGGWRNP
jgi:hypothetical protein